MIKYYTHSEDRRHLFKVLGRKKGLKDGWNITRIAGNYNNDHILLNDFSRQYWVPATKIEIKLGFLRRQD